MNIFIYFHNESNIVPNHKIMLSLIKIKKTSQIMFPSLADILWEFYRFVVKRK